MSFRITKNILTSGRDSDRDFAYQQPDFFIDAQNIDITKSGSFLGVSNIKGTTYLNSLLPNTNFDVLGAFEAKFKIGNTSNVPCLVIFTFYNNLLKIWCHDISNNNIYELYEKTVPSDYMSDDRLISAYRYGEHDIDVLYFTDFYHELRQLRCVIPNSYTPNFLTDYDLSLQRKGAVGRINIVAVEKGGSLLSGTYQYCYRMVDPVSKRVTRWSSLTLPIPVHLNTSVDLRYRYSDVGLYTNMRVKLDIIPTESELNNFSHFQLAVIENIYPTPPSSAVLLPIAPISQLSNFIHNSNHKVDVIPIDDIVVDQAAIETAKTITVNSNRLIAGNVRYRKLDFDNGPPTVANGSISVMKYVVPDSHNEGAYRYRGYFRGEVYRFGIVYEDADGNKSEPYPLDMSNVVGNQISSGLKDMKFPERHWNNSQYSLLDSNNLKKSIGLNLTVVNHPKWAKAFEIVRVKRIPRILFQTPVIPMMRVKGTGAISSYPSTFSTYHGTQGVDLSQPSAKPMTSAEVYVPKNFLFPEFRRIAGRPAAVLIGIFRYLRGEAIYELEPFYSLAMILPPDRYGVLFVNTGNEAIEIVDRALLRLQPTTYSSDTPYGDYKDTSLQVTAHALRADQYAACEGYNLIIQANTIKITDYKLFENGSPGGVLSGLKVLQYKDLFTEGSQEVQYEPSVYTCGVIRLAQSINDNRALSFPVGTRLAYAPGGNIVSTQSSPKYSTFLDNRFINSYSGFTPFSYVQAVEIANVVNSVIGDDRYGDLFTQHEYISTGTRYVFSESEVQNYIKPGVSYPVTVSVFGGDCFVTESLYKITNSTYVISNYPKQDAFNAFQKWGGGYNDLFFNNTYLNLPVALKNVAQYLQLVIESPDNVQVMAEDQLIATTGSGNSVVWGALSESNLNSPLLNKYNVNLSKQNDQKVYLSLPQVDVRNNIFKSRIIYSDLKIYNTLVTGFDIFRPINFVDLPEVYGAIMSLNNVGDNLYSLQESGVIMLPVGETQITTTKDQVLTVGTPGVFGRLIVVDNSIGTQHHRSVVYTGHSLFFADARNKAVYKLSNRGLEFLNKFNNSFFRDKLSTTIPERLLLGVYDHVKKQYLLVDSHNFWSQKYDELIDNWSGGISFGPTHSLQAAVFVNGYTYFVGNTNETGIYTMYTGGVNQIFGVPVVPFVSFVVNPKEYEWAKVFDVLYVSSTDKLSHVDLEVYHSPDWGTQTVLNQPIDVNYKEGLYCIPTLRDANKARLRGLRMLVKLYWGANLATVSAIYTKYRMSPRIPAI